VGFFCGGGYAGWLLGRGSDYFFGMCGVAVSCHDKCTVGLVSGVFVNGRQLGFVGLDVLVSCFPLMGSPYRECACGLWVPRRRGWGTSLALT